MKKYLVNVHNFSKKVAMAQMAERRLRSSEELSLNPAVSGFIMIFSQVKKMCSLKCVYFALDDVYGVKEVLIMLLIRRVIIVHIINRYTNQFYF